jgi:hypothetical protein
VFTTEGAEATANNYVEQLALGSKLLEPVANPYFGEIPADSPLADRPRLGRVVVA